MKYIALLLLCFSMATHAMDYGSKDWEEYLAAFEEANDETSFVENTRPLLKL